MKKQIFNTILQVIKPFSQEVGVSLKDILQALTPPLPKRSLQRYLAFLIKEGHLNTLGKACLRKYCLSSKENEKITPTTPFPVLQDVKALILLSSNEIRIHCLKPSVYWS